RAPRAAGAAAACRREAAAAACGAPSRSRPLPAWRPPRAAQARAPSGAPSGTSRRGRAAPR
ncbi:unnamed protein product, partial [Prorocentrum cordatum]